MQLHCAIGFRLFFHLWHFCKFHLWLNLCGLIFFRFPSSLLPVHCPDYRSVVLCFLACSCPVFLNFKIILFTLFICSWWPTNYQTKMGFTKSFSRYLFAYLRV